MKKGKKILVYVLLALALVLSACGSSETASGVFRNAELDDNGDIVIREADISTDATFINYDVDGVTVQFIAVQDSGGVVRLGYNTCQSCSPSPRAYFAQDGDRLVCQNCGLSFSAENVGAGGLWLQPRGCDRRCPGRGDHYCSRVRCGGDGRSVCQLAGPYRLISFTFLRGVF